MEDVGMYFSYNSSEKSDIIMIENVEELKTQCYGKDLTKMLKILQLKKWGSWDSNLYGEFYKFYAKIKGFGVQENGSRKSRIDGHPTLRIYKCSLEGLREQKHVYNCKWIRAPKTLTRCLYKVEMRFKWIKDVDYWIVTKFETKHTHRLAKPSDVLYIRFEFSLLMFYVCDRN